MVNFRLPNYDKLGNMCGWKVKIDLIVKVRHYTSGNAAKYQFLLTFVNVNSIRINGPNGGELHISNRVSFGPDYVFSLLR